MAAKPKSRNPGGVCRQKPISLRLMKQERSRADRLSTRHGITLSAIARMAFIAGIETVEDQLGKS